VLQAAGVTTQVTVSRNRLPLTPARLLSRLRRPGKDRGSAGAQPQCLDFVLLMPGVTASSQRSGTGSRRALPDSGFTFGGLRPRSNNISVDGSTTTMNIPVRSRPSFPEMFMNISGEQWLSGIRWRLGGSNRYIHRCCRAHRRRCCCCAGATAKSEAAIWERAARAGPTSL